MIFFLTNVILDVSFGTIWWITKNTTYGVINGIYYTIIDYIHVSLKTSEKLMSYLEIDFYLTDEFIETDYPELYIQANRKFHENGLILHIFDNFHKIDSPPHRRMMFYFMNILYFDL